MNKIITISLFFLAAISCNNAKKETPASIKDTAVAVAPPAKKNTITSPLIEVFNGLEAGERNGITIKEVNGIWIGHSAETEQDLPLRIGENGNFLEIVDPGTGGGTTTFQLKIFKAADGTEIVANNKSWTDGAMGEGGFNFFDLKTKTDETLSVFPDMGEEIFFVEGQDKTGGEKYFTNEYSQGRIIENSNTLETQSHYAGINAACISDDKKGCDLKKRLKDKVVLTWDADKKTFVL